ncbi:hypothetical protein BDV98DRAFT_551347 [Pterulicium gracile]|uniref:deuterolysin n=1 Tax=Pterulicium gracile TaxID=1884261 RepID=A0A5C3QCT0_9AGAR|nr:hypothetical protein BDV98DRAFT_551347 [Pterula gracilis]
MRLQAALLALSSSALALAAVVTPSHNSRAIDGLSVEVSNANGPSVASIDDLVLVSKVTNVGDEPIRVIKYGGLLDAGYLQSFIVKKDGKDVPFTGIVAQFGVTYADAALYRTIAPGETVTTEHKVAALYDFKSVGTGEFTFEPLLDRGLDVGESASRSTGQAHALPTTSVKVAQDVATRVVAESQLDKRATPQCTTNATQLAIIQAAYQDSKLLAATAASHITVHGTSTLYSRYFKDNPTAAILARYRSVADEKVARILSCTDAAFQCPGDVILAYTWTQTFNVHFCPIFYNQVPSYRLCSGVNVHQNRISGATVLHEMLHTISMYGQVSANWIVDITSRGCAASQGLSAGEQAVNADSFACLATEVYVNNNCPES